jgi:hypothetical protein
MSINTIMTKNKLKNPNYMQKNNKIKKENIKKIKLRYRPKRNFSQCFKRQILIIKLMQFQI